MSQPLSNDYQLTTPNSQPTTSEHQPTNSSNEPLNANNRSTSTEDDPHTSGAKTINPNNHMAVSDDVKTLSPWTHQLPRIANHPSRDSWIFPRRLGMISTNISSSFRRCADYVSAQSTRRGRTLRATRLLGLVE